MTTIRSPFWRSQVSRVTASFCAFFLAAFVPTSAHAACVTATAGNVWLNTALSAVQTHSFTAYYDATPSASPINAFVGLSKGAPTAFTGFATLERFSPTGQIDARNGSNFNAVSVIPYSAGRTYHFRVAVNVATHTYSIYVTPPGGSELIVGLNYAFRSEQNNVTQLDHWGVHVDPSNGGSLTVCNFSIGVPTAPVFSPAAGAYTGAQSVTITSTDATAIYYTTNGTTPTTSSSLYSGSVSLPIGITTLKAIAVNANGSSTVTTGTYILNPPAPLTPVFSPAGGTFTSAQPVTITSAGATAIYYTTNGTTPTTSSTLYTGPLTIANNTVLKAIGMNAGGTSPVGTASFTILPPAPSFSPTPGTYTNVTTFSVTISDAASATIYYTTDGSGPSTTSTPYTGPVSLPIGTTTLSAIAINSNGSSTVTTGTYMLAPPPPQTPVFSPAGGSFTSPQLVTITSLGATVIYYTTDSSPPNTGSTLYTGPLTIANNTVLNAIGVNSGGNSLVGTASFTILPPPPAFSPAPGTYTNVTTFSVTIGDAASATIYYTTDGSTPTTSSTPYTGAVSLPICTTTLSAIAINANGSSTVTTGTYMLTPPPPQTPVFSPAGGTFTSGQSVTITSLGATAIYYTTDSSPPNTGSTLYTGPLTIANNTVLNAIGVNSGGNSLVGTASFTILPPAPTFSPAPGTYTNVTTFSVTISDAASATIYYTTDGSGPSTTSTPYTGPVSLPIGTTTLSAIAINGNGSSTVTAGTYILTPPPPQTPVFSPAGGSFTSGQSVTITSLGATAIYYTTDSSPPSTSSTLYTGPLTIANNTVLNAIGINGGGNSLVGTASFTILPPVPSFSPTPGTYSNITTFSVTITDAASATIYYTTDGSGPSTTSTPYTGPVSLPIGTTTLGAIAINANGSSTVTTGTYILTPPPPQTPVFSPAGGTFTSGQSVTITSLGATAIYYTTDSSPPNTGSTLYAGPLTIANNTVLNAIGVNSGGLSPTGTASFTILLPPPPSTPIFSPAGGTFASPQSVTITSSNATAIYYTTGGSAPTTLSTLYTGPITIANSTVLEAFGVNSGGFSSVATADYSIIPPSFSLAANPASQTVLPGESTGCTITVIPVTGFSGLVNLIIAGLPNGVTATFSPSSVPGSGNSTLTVSASGSAPTGTYITTITGKSSSSITSPSIPVTLNVSTNGALQQAISVVGQMSLAEEISQVHGSENGGDRYIPASAHAPQYNFTNGPAGIGASGPGHGGSATAMPAPIALAATFDVNLAYLYGSIVGQEAVDYSNDMIEGPDINIARVPQNGRTFEAYGEDPYLVGQIAVNEIEGVQAQGISAESKHFAGNNQETNRMFINDIIDERTLREIYLPAFEATVLQGHVDAVMGAYNLVNGSYCCQNMTLLHDILKGEWGFTGYVTSDFGATNSTVPSALAGLDAEMPTAVYYGSALQTAVQADQVPKAVLDEMLIRRFSTMINRGEFHAPLPNKPIPIAADGATALQIAEAGMVLLKNNGNTLPLQIPQLHTIALIGPFATSAKTGGGGSSQVTPIITPVTPLAGLQARVSGTGITVQVNDGSIIASAVALAQTSTVAIVMVGDNETEGVDDSISLSGNGYPNQDALVEAVAAANPNTVVVLKTGTAVLMPWVNQVPAILEAWYPGEEDGNAVAAVLFGDVNPSGKLPLTFPVNVSDCPANTPAQYPGVNDTANYSEGIFVGYRHYDESDITPLFPFGHGLSYTTFQYQNLVINPTSTTFVGNPGNTVSVDFDITNTGPVAGSEAAQIYVGKPPLPNGLPDAPQWLKGFQKISITSGQTGHVHVVLNLRSFAYWDVTTHAWLVAPGNYAIYVGSSSRDIRLMGQVTIN